MLNTEVSSCESDGFTCTLTGLDSGTDYNISVIGIYSSMSQSDPSSPLLATTGMRSVYHILNLITKKTFKLSV